MPCLCLRLFDTFAATLDGQTTIFFDYDKVRALLAFLACEHGRPYRRDELCGLLWPEDDQTRARQSLSQALYSLRQSFLRAGAESTYILANRVEVQLDPAPSWQVDTGSFQQLIRAGFDATDAQERIALLKEAMNHYAGPFLAGFALPDSSAWDEWVLLQRERLHRLAADALRSLVHDYGEQGDLAGALHWARRQVEIDPWQEEGHREVMRLLAGLGRRSEALAQFENCQRTLRQELDVEPTAQTWMLYQTLRDGGKVADSVADAGLTQQKRPRLPLPRAGFLGRETELEQIRRRLADPACRLITIVGMGGMGKTQTALQAAHAHQADFAAGVAFVPLVGANTLEDIVAAIHTGLGRTATSSAAQLAATLRPLHLLLILDNCEHLADSLRLLSQLLENAPRLKILATSRQRLNLAEEWLMPLEGLQVPPVPGPDGVMAHEEILDALSAFAATQLFVNCLRRVRPGPQFTPQDAAHIIAICRQVDGMPLALELTASWRRFLTLAEIAAQINHALDLPSATIKDIPARHRSIRAVFDRSWKLLTPQAAACLRQLAVFRGGFTLRAAQSVADADLADLADLMDRCWLRMDETGRYDLHELVRQVCTERLEDAPAQVGQAVRSRHAAFYAAFLNEHEAGYNRKSQALAAITVEIGNIEAAWHWVTVHGDAATIYPFYLGLYFIGDMWGWLGLVQPLFTQGVASLKTRLYDEKLDADELDATAILIAHIQDALGSMFLSRGHITPALDCFQDGEILIEQVAPGEDRQFVWSYLRLGQALAFSHQGLYAQAERILRQQFIPHWEEATRARYASPEFSLAHGYGLLGHVLVSRGEYAAAYPLLQRSLDLRRRIGEKRFRGGLYASLARAYQGQGMSAQALEAAREGVRLNREFGDRVNLGVALGTWGGLLLHDGQIDAGRACFEEAQMLAVETANPARRAWSIIGLAAVALADGQVDEATWLAGEARTCYQEEGVEAVDLWSEILLLQGRCARAADLPQSAASYFQDVLDQPHVSPPYRQVAQVALAGCGPHPNWVDSDNP